MTLTDAQVAIAAVEAGAQVIRAAYGADQVRLPKSSTDFATQTDINAEIAIRRILNESCPADAVVGEELGDTGPPTAQRRWLVDPLCGTLNFAATTPLMAVNVALVDHGHVTAAASADPIAMETFWTDGATGFVRRAGVDHPLLPTATSGLVEINADVPKSGVSVSAQLVGDVAFRNRFSPRVLSTTLGVAWVAAGRRAAYVSDGSFHEDLHFAAGLAIAEASGCVITDLNGAPLHTGDGVIISASDEAHTAVVEFIAPHAQRLR